MAASVVPELVLESRDRCDVYLPDQAEGPIEVWAGNDGFQAYGYAGGGYYWAHLPGTGTFRFDEGESDVVGVADPGIPAALVEDAYHRNVLPLVLHLRGYEALHASAVIAAGGLLVLCGLSGSGKSTLAHALSERGYPAWADDVVVVDVGDHATYALGVPFRLHLHGPAAAFFVRPSGRVTPSGDAASSRVRALAILVPRGSDTPPIDIVRLAPARAFTALLPHAYYFQLSDPARNALMVDRYLQLAGSVPAYEIVYRRGLEVVATVLDEIEAQILAR